MTFANTSETAPFSMPAFSPREDNSGHRVRSSSPLLPIVRPVIRCAYPGTHFDEWIHKTRCKLFDVLLSAYRFPFIDGVFIPFGERRLFPSRTKVRLMRLYLIPLFRFLHTCRQ